MRIITRTLRLIRRNPLFTVINIVGLTLGFAVLFGIGTYVIGEFSYDKHHSKADRIFRVTMDIQDNQYNIHWARQNIDYVNRMPEYFPQIEHMIRFQDYYPRDVEVNGEVQRIPHAYTTDPEVFDVFDFELISGNPETALAEPNSVVLTEQLAIRLFGRINVMGEQLILRDNTGMEEITYAVTGVMTDVPSNSHMPVNMLTSFASEEARVGWAYTYVLLNNAESAAEIENDLKNFILEYADEEEASVMNIPLQPLRDIHISGGLAREIMPVNNRKQLMLFTGVGMVVFLLTLINFVNLNSAQALKRQAEIGVRKVLGAGRSRISAQFIGESMVIVLISVAVATLSFQLIRPQLQTILPSTVTHWDMLPWVLLAGLATALLAAWYPSVVLNGRKSVNSMRDKDISTGAFLSARTLLVGFQMVLCIAMVSAAIISTEQFRYISQKNLGIDKAQILALKDLAEPVKQRKDYLKQQLGTLPGIEAVSAVMEIPSREIRDAGPVYVRSKGWTEEQAPVMDVQVIDENFISLMNMDLLAGKNFDPVAEDPEVGEDFMAYLLSAPREYLINETALRAMGWTDPTDAIGEIMSWQIGELKLQDGPIIGVVKDYHQETLRNSIEPLVLVREPLWTRQVLVKVGPGQTQQVMAGISDLWEREFAEFPLETAFLDDLYAQLYAADARQIQLMRYFSALAIAISFLGIFGLLTYIMKTREKELAIRKILGASLGSITRLVSKRFVVTTFIGAVIAIPSTWFLMQKWLAGFAYRIPVSASYFLISLLVVVSVFLLVVLFQTRRLSSTNPTEILRSE